MPPVIDQFEFAPHIFQPDAAATRAATIRTTPFSRKESLLVGRIFNR